MEKCKCGSTNIFKRDVVEKTSLHSSKFDDPETKIYIEYMCMDCTYTSRVKK